MEGKSAKIVVNKYNDALCLKLNVNNKLSWHETKIYYDKMGIDDLLFYWMLKSMKPIFFEMPLEKIQTACSKDVYERFGKILDNFATILTLTNDAITKYKHLKGIAEHSNNILFINVNNDYRYKSLYNKLRRANAVKVLYLNMDPGFNKFTRTWEDRDVPLPLSDLLIFIEKEGIKKIVSINHYFLEKYLEKNGVNLIPFFWYIGVEYVIIDNDPPDLRPYGYLFKALNNCNSFDRFSNLSVLNEYWDDIYKLQNVHYVAIPQDYKKNRKTHKLEEDYAVLVLSNSRLENVRLRIRSIIYLLDHIEDNSVFTEVQLWYMALRYMILNIMKLDEFERLYYNSMLHMFFYTVAQFMKYEVIESLDTKRKIEVYGNIGWETIFPEYYKKLLENKEIDDLFSRNSHLYLLLNCSFSYLDASGPVYDAIRRNVPFINMPPLVRTSEFKGFRHIEYNDRTELNHLVENIQTIFDNEELKDSIHNYRKVLTGSTKSILNRVLLGDDTQDDGGAFGGECKEHQILLDQMIEEYIDRNEPFLRETFRGLFLGEPVQYDISKSRYFNRKYMQRILKSIRDEQSAST